MGCRTALAALELQGAADPTGFVDAFSGDDHAVAAYLLDEVIDRLAPDLLEFLVLDRDIVEAEKHLRAAVDLAQSGGALRPHLNAAAHLALLHCEQGDLDAAENEARVVAEHAGDAGWTFHLFVASHLRSGATLIDRRAPVVIGR
jgi:hypothetical protein